MKEEIHTELSCYQCDLKFDAKVWYDMHLSLVHESENTTESLRKGVKREQKNLELSFSRGTLSHRIDYTPRKKSFFYVLYDMCF